MPSRRERVKEEKLSSFFERFLAFTEDVKSGPGPLIICLGFICLVALMLPSDGDKNTSLPPYLHLTLNQKLIAAYILGKMQAKY